MANPTNTTPRGVAGQTLTTLYAKISTLWANPLDPVGQPSGPCGPTLWTIADPVRPQEMAHRVVKN